MIDNTLDSLDFTDWIWGYQLNLSSIIIPNNLVAATRDNITLSMLTHYQAVHCGKTFNNLFPPHLMIIY